MILFCLFLRECSRSFIISSKVPITQYKKIQTTDFKTDLWLSSSIWIFIDIILIFIIKLSSVLDSFFPLLDSFFFSFIFISWRLTTSQHFSGFCHTLTWISHGVTCIPHPDPPWHLPLHPIPLGLRSLSMNPHDLFLQKLGILVTFSRF